MALAAVVLFAGRALAEGPPGLAGSLNAPEFWQAYKQSFISRGGRVIDNANRDISHSEGQGYGMVLAVAADDPDTFATLWQWTRSQLMLRDDGLAAWRWDPAATPHVADRNNAADGDLLIAWALAEAGETWSQPAYRTAALQMARSLLAHDVADSPIGPVLRPGTAGFAASDRPDGPVVNPSYWVFPALARLAVLVPDPAWSPLIASGLRLVRSARFGAQALPSDWVSLAGGRPQPAKGFAPTFGYDAIRVPLYLAWARLGDSPILDPFAAAFADPAVPPHRIDVATDQAVEPLADSGYRAVAALTRCARRGTPIPPELRGAEVDRYYPSTLRALTLVAARQSFPRCL